MVDPRIPSTVLTVAQVAELLQVDPRTVYRWVHEDYIPSMKLGGCRRFRLADLEAWMQAKSALGRLTHDLEVGV